MISASCRFPRELGDLGFSGVRILSNAGAEGWKDAAIFQGATFFRSLARGQAYGVSARALSLRTGDAQGEEFPVFRALWIEKPSPAADALVIHALLDSASVTGAFRFTLRAGDATIIDTELTLFARVAVDHLGLGSMSATYLFGPLDHFHSDDVQGQCLRRLRLADSDRRGGMDLARRSPIARPFRSPRSATKIRAASGCCSATAASTPSATTTPIGNFGPRSGLNRSATGVKAK